MRLVLAAAATLALSLPAAAQSLDVPSGTYVLDPTHASIVWKVSHFGFSTYTGAIERGAIDASVELDADDVSKSKLSVTIDGQRVASLHPVDRDPRGVDFDTEIEGPMFLNTAANPTVTFVATKIEPTDDNTALITGDFTLNGVTKPVTLDATLNKAAVNPMYGVPVLGVSATGTLDRTAWGVNGLAGPIGTDVTLEIQAEFVHQN